MLGLRTIGSAPLGGGGGGLQNSFVLAATANAFALTGVAATINSIRSMAIAAGAYVLTGRASTGTRTKLLIAATGAYVLTGANAVLTHFTAPLSAIQIRVANFILQKRRSSAPTLEE